MAKIEFQALLTGISSAVQQTQLAMGEVQKEYFLSHFHQENDDLIPDTKQIEIKLSEGGERKTGKIEVPVATLVTYGGLALDDVEVTMHTALAAEAGQLMAEIGDNERKEECTPDANQDMPEKAGSCDIKLHFQNKNAADGAMEVVNMLNKMI